MNILIVSRSAYPEGMAISKRIRLIAKGLQECGNNVYVRILNPTTLPGRNDCNPNSGEFPKGVFFEYSGGERIWSKGWLIRRLQTLKGTMCGIFNTFHQMKDLDVVMLYTTGSPSIILHKILCKLFDKKFVLFRSEHPFFENQNWLYKLIVTKFTHRFFDAYIVISKGIKKFYESIGIDSKQILIIPIINDPVPCNNGNISPNKTNTIFYCGDWSQHKDGLMTLLKAFAIVVKKQVNLKLELAGKPFSTEYIKSVNDFISKNRIEDRTIMTGYLDNDEFQHRMNRATMFVLPKPLNFQAQFSMPSKLAEYLSTGKPVVASDMGDLSKYLKNRVSVYFTAPGNHEEVAFAMSYIIENSDKARTVGEEGKRIAMTEFDYLNNCKKIFNFLKSL